jgi:alpha-beta hydrolase superfamily lysophospholipase
MNVAPARAPRSIAPRPGAALVTRRARWTAAALPVKVMDMRRAALLVLCLLLPACAPRVAPMGPALTTPRIEGAALVAADGVSLPLREWHPGCLPPPEPVPPAPHRPGGSPDFAAGQRPPPPPPATPAWAAGTTAGCAGARPPRGVLLALHGLNDHSGNFLLESLPGLAAAGWQVVAYDHRGFGRSPNRGIWAGADTLAADARGAVAALRARHPGLPVALLGESMGGAVALLAVQGARGPERPDRLVLLAPALWPEDAFPGLWRAGLDVLAHTVPLMGFRATAPGVVASDNAAALRRFGEDPLTLKEVSIELLHGLVRLMWDAAARSRGCCAAPTLVLHGANDRVVQGGPLRAALATADGTLRVARYAQGWHLLLRDRVREVVLADLLRFLDDARAPLPSGAEAAGRAWVSGGSS